MDPLEAAELGFRRALVTLDGSMVAEAILPAFLRMAHPLGMEVVLVRVVPTTQPTAVEDARSPLENAERMRQEVRRLLFGSVAEAVLRAAHVPVFILRAAHLEATLRVA